MTDPTMERYFMTIPEACSLVLQTGGVGVNGESYLLDMGEPIKIKDLAEQIIKFSGLEVGKDIEIKYTGARKGERLTEPLWLKEENPEPTAFPKVLRMDNSAKNNFSLDELLQKLKPICFAGQDAADFKIYRNAKELKAILCEAIPSLKEFYAKGEKGE